MTLFLVLCQHFDIVLVKILHHFDCSLRRLIFNIPIADPWEYSDPFNVSELRQILSYQILIIFIAVPKVSNQESLGQCLPLLGNNFF